METIKKTFFYVTLVFIVLMVIFETTLIQTIPFIGAAILQYFIIWEKRKLEVWILVLGAIMFFVNLTPPPSWIDVLYWVLAFLVFAKLKPETQK